MNSILSDELIEIFEKISKDRTRTNLLKNIEQKTLAFLVKHIPFWIKSDMLTFIGFLGSLTILISFLLSKYIHKSYLLIGVLGFVINWFGDSLDGRVAYYRNQSRKWYGFSLDLTFDWIGTILIGSGYVIYVEGYWKLAGFGFVVMYGWAIITALLRYKVTGKYIIDSGLFGPTELRIIVSAILVAEVLFKDAILYSGLFACAALFMINVNDTLKLLKLANSRDMTEKEKKEKTEND